MCACIYVLSVYVFVDAHMVRVFANPLRVNESMNYSYDVRSYVTKSWEFRCRKNRHVCDIICYIAQTFKHERSLHGSLFKLDRGRL